MSERLTLMDRVADIVAAHSADDNPNPDVTAREILRALEDAGWAAPSRVSALLAANHAEIERRRESEKRLLDLLAQTRTA